MTEILVTIDEGGHTEVKVQGCIGPSCSDLTKGIEEALGAVVSDSKTAEYFQSAKQQQIAKTGSK